MDTLVNPFKQASMGIVKGVSMIGGGLTIVSDTVTENAGKIFRTSANNADRLKIDMHNDSQTFSTAEEQAEVSAHEQPVGKVIDILSFVRMPRTFHCECCS